MNPLPLVIAELRRNPLGCAAIVILIAIAVALGIAVTTQERALREASNIAAQRFDLVIGAPGSATQLILTTVYLQPAALDLLPKAALLELAQEPGVEAVAPVAVTDSYQGYTVVGTSAAFAGTGGVIEGRVFADDTEAVVGSLVALPLGYKLFPAHGSAAENVLESHEHQHLLTVVGRLTPSGTPWDRAIVVPIEALWAMHADAQSQRLPLVPLQLGPPWREDQVGRVPAIVVKPRSVADAYRLRTKYRGRETTALFPAEVLLPLYALLGDVRDVVVSMSLAFQVLLIAAVLLVIVAVLAARRQSLGVLRALGAPPAFVFLTVWLQSVLLMAAGLLVGVGFGWVLSHSLSSFAAARTGLAMNASPGIREVVQMLVLLVAGASFAALPSLVALRVPAARLLRTG